MKCRGSSISGFISTVFFRNCNSKPQNHAWTIGLISGRGGKSNLLVDLHAVILTIHKSNEIALYQNSHHSRKANLLAMCAPNTGRKPDSLLMAKGPGCMLAISPGSLRCPCGKQSKCVWAPSCKIRQGRGTSTAVMPPRSLK